VVGRRVRSRGRVVVGRDRRRRAGYVILLGRRRRVLAVPVPAQIHLPLERPLALAARERPVSRVLTQVRDQVGRLAERFETHHALVGFLACTKRKEQKKTDPR